MEKRLYKGDDKLVGGVMGGFAEYFGGDPVLWRLAALLFALLTAIIPVAVVYAVAWWIMPEKPRIDYRVVEQPVSRDDD